MSLDDQLADSATELRSAGMQSLAVAVEVARERLRNPSTRLLVPVEDGLYLKGAPDAPR